MKKIVKFLAITTAVIGVSLASRVSASAKTTYQYSYTCDNGGVPYLLERQKFLMVVFYGIRSIRKKLVI